MKEYVIVGDTKDYKGCLVCLCGCSIEHAKNTLSRMLSNPNDNDKKIIEGHTNLRIKTIKEEDCWWHHGCD